MKYLISILFLALSLPAIAQFRMVSDGVPVWTVVDDSTYTATINFQADLTGFSYLGTQITDTFQMFTGTEQLYRISNVGSASFSSATLTVVEISNDYTTTTTEPSGQVIVFNPDERIKIPQNPFGSSGATAQMQAAIDSYNARIQSDVVAGTGINVAGGYPEFTVSNTNSQQDLSLTGNTLSLTDDPTPVDLSGYLDNTDGQTLSIVENVLNITGGNSVSLSPYLDNTDTQDLSLTGNTLSLTDGGSVDLSGLDSPPQTLSLAVSAGTATTTLSDSGGNVTIQAGQGIDIESAGTNTARINNTEAAAVMADNYADAATKGVQYGAYFYTSQNNTMGLPAGVKIKRIY